MTRTLPDYTRMAWASETARDWWLPRIRAFTAAWDNIERWAVVDGVRQAALQACAPERMVELGAWCAKHGLGLLPVAVNATGGIYSTTSAPPQAGQPWTYRTVVAQPEVMAEFVAAFAVNDNETIGRLLGYPACCRAAFAATWGAGQVDSMWEQAQPSPEGSSLANAFLRHLGIRMVPHMPCHAGCLASADFGDGLLKSGIAHGFEPVLGEALRILNWPIRWSRLHGIAEIVTPAVKISTRTDWTPDLQRFERSGTYAEPSPRLQIRKSAPDNWTANGFSSRAAQDEAHEALLKAISGAVAVPEGSVVVDLGAGNGLLLSRLLALFPGTSGLAVEIDPLRVDRGWAGIRWQVGSLVNTTWAFVATTILLMPGRLLELPEEDAAKVRAALEGRQVVVYAYGDWRERYPSLEALCLAAGLSAPTMLGEWVGTL